MNNIFSYPLIHSSHKASPPPCVNKLNRNRSTERIVNRLPVACKLLIVFRNANVLQSVGHFCSAWASFALHFCNGKYLIWIYPFSPKIQPIARMNIDGCVYDAFHLLLIFTLTVFVSTLTWSPTLDLYKCSHWYRHVVHCFVRSITLLN